MSCASLNSRPYSCVKIQPDIVPRTTLLWACTSWLYVTRNLRMPKILENSFSWRYIHPWQLYDGLPLPSRRSKHKRPSIHQWFKFQLYFLARCFKWSLAPCRKHRVPWHYCGSWLARYSRWAIQMGIGIPMCWIIAQHHFCWNQFLCAWQRWPWSEA